MEQHTAEQHILTQRVKMQYVKRRSYNECDLVDVPQIIAENNINDTDLEGKTITFTVCRIGCLKTLKQLVECGADVNILDNYNSTCLAVAAGVGHVNLVRYLIEELGMDMNEKNNKNQPLITIASKCGRLGVVQYLVEHGADLSVLDISGLSCLMYSVNRNNLHVTKYLVEQKINPINLNEYTDSGMDALMFACKNCNFEAVKILVEAGTRIDNLNSKGKTCLYFAISKGKRGEKIAEYLISHGAGLHKTPNHVTKECVNKILNNITNKIKKNRIDNASEDTGSISDSISNLDNLSTMDDDSPVIDYTDFDF